MPGLTQRTLGYVRDVLDAMQPEDVYTAFEIIDFWKRTLFDSGFPTRFIEIAATYSFRWTDIIPDLFTGKFGPHNQAFASLVPPEIGEQFLRKLVAFAASESDGSPTGRRLLESLKNDGFLPSPTAQGDIPAELAKLPDKESLLRDLVAQTDDGKPTSVMFIDLDNFKQVNDEHGHSEGDKCLVKIVATVRGAIIGKGQLYRVGGDEFCVMLPNFSSSESAATAERVRVAVNALEPFGGTTKVTTSIGVAASDGAGLTDPESVFKAADDAMYISKWTTKNRVTTWPPSDAEKQRASENRSRAKQNKTR